VFNVSIVWCCCLFELIVKLSVLGYAAAFGSGADRGSDTLAQMLSDNITLDEKRLQFRYEGGIRGSSITSLLAKAYKVRNAVRYQRPLRYSFLAGALVLVLSLLFDDKPFQPDGYSDWLLLIARLCLALPATLLTVLFTFTLTYRRRPNWVGIPASIIVVAAIIITVFAEDAGKCPNRVSK
jgi:hypothetical protein